MRKHKQEDLARIARLKLNKKNKSRNSNHLRRL